MQQSARAGAGACMRRGSICSNMDDTNHLLGPKLFFVTGLVIFITAVARLVCPDLLG